MANPYFRFKKFIVYHDKCAMKVGTDGVLLGAWADISSSKNILDIGTGTGLISFMLAQRLSYNCSIDAIDIEENAITQTNENINRNAISCIKAHHSSLQDFVKNASEKYDLIVSNPPYFTSSLQAPNYERTLARHNDSLSLKELICLSNSLLTDDGKMSIVYPYQDKDVILAYAELCGLYSTRLTYVKGEASKPYKRILVELSKKQQSLQESELIIEESRNNYTNEFKALVKDFYLKIPD